MEIREMKEEDIEDVYRIEKSSFSKPWSKESFLKEIKVNINSIYLVTIFEEKVVGYIGIWKILDEGHITNIVVSKMYRGKGIGEKMLRRIIEIGNMSGINSFTLEVRKENNIAKNLYEKLDFKVVGERKNYYSDGETAVIMWR